MAEHRYSKHWDVQGKRIIDCETCGFKHIEVSPDAQELAQFYARQYTEVVKPFDYEGVTDAQIQENIKIVLEYQGYKKIYDKVMQYKVNGEKKMLDIGCGLDLLSYYFLKHGWNVDILEPGKDTADYLRKYGLNVFCLPAEAIKDINAREFSFVNMQFVLEHLADPIAVLRDVYELLAPGGVLRICVPNDFSEGQKAYMEYFNESPRWVCLPDHINYFDFNSLAGLLVKIGYEELYRTTTFPLELLLLGGLNYYKDDRVREKVGPFIKNFESAFITTGRLKYLEKIYESFAGAGLGRNIVMFVRKPV